MSRLERDDEDGDVEEKKRMNMSESASATGAANVKFEVAVPLEEISLYM